MAVKTDVRSLHEIASDVRKDWKPVSPYAKPYLDAMAQLTSVNDRYYFEDGKTQVILFLSNASTWRGEKAKAIKAELKSLVK